MTNTLRLISAAAGLVLFASATQARAGGGSCCADGIAASPKVHAMLDERCRNMCAAPAEVTVTTTRQSELAASPKVQQMRSQNASAPVVVVTTETAAYRPTGADDITASPKVRAMLNEQAQVIQIAPLK